LTTVAAARTGSGLTRYGPVDGRGSSRSDAHDCRAVWRSGGALEPYSVEHVPLAGRHDRGRDLLWLWLAANLTIADYSLGFLPVSLGLPLGATLLALAVGNVLGGTLLALCAAMGPRAGYPQMLLGRRAFGHRGLRVGIGRHGGPSHSGWRATEPGSERFRTREWSQYDMCLNRGCTRVAA